MTRRVLAILGLLVIAASPLSAEVKVCGIDYDASHPWSTESVNARYKGEFAPLIETYSFRKMYAALLEDFKKSRPIVTEHREAFENAYARHLEQDFPRVGAPRFKPETARSGPRDPWHAVVLGFDLSRCPESEEGRRGFREFWYFANAMWMLGDKEWEEVRQLGAEHLGEVHRKFDERLFEGFPMFPWEAALNGWLFLAEEDVVRGPPSGQAIFLHPAAGLEVDGTALSRTGLKPVLGVELLGGVRYFGARDRSWAGAGILAVFRDGAGMGLGGALHFDDYTLGALWHHEGPGRGFRDGPFIFFNVDLYAFVSDRLKRYDGILGRVDYAREKILRKE